MSGFKKAKAEQAALKMGLYGPAGSGKTFTALLLAEGLAALDGRRVAYIDTEHGTDFYCQKVEARRVHPEAFDFDALYTRSIYDVLDEVQKLDPKTHAVVVLDSITHLWEAAIASYSGKKTSIDTIPMHAWGAIKKPYKKLMGLLLESPLHFIICGRQKSIFEEDENGELKAVGTTMRSEGETPYEPHILIRMHGIPPKKQEDDGVVMAYAEKDRTGVLAGRAIINPNFDNICKPLLPLLGSVQAKVASADETAAHDAEQAAVQEKQREEASSRLLKDFSARIQLAPDSAALKKIGKEITADLKAQMLPADVATLRAVYQEREGELSKVAGGVK